MWIRALTITLMVSHVAGFIAQAPFSSKLNNRNQLASARILHRAASPRTLNRLHVFKMEESSSSASTSLTKSPMPAIEKAGVQKETDSEGKLAPATPSEALRQIFSRWGETMTVKQATWILMAIVAVSGMAFAATKYAATAFESNTILAVRFLVAALVLAPWLRTDRKTFLAGMETSVYLTLGYATQVLCMAGGTSAGVASFFASMSCIVTPFLEVLFASVVLTARSWVAAALAVAGAGFLCLWDGLPSPADMIGLLQAFFFGLHLFRVERVLKKHPGKAMEITAIQMLFIAVAATALGGVQGVLAGGIPAVGQLAGSAVEWVGGLASKVPQLLAIVWLGLVPSAMALSLETMVVSKLSASRVALMFATEPLWAALLACTFLGETLGINLVIGGALATAAILTRSKDTVLRKIGEVRELLAPKLKEKTA